MDLKPASAATANSSAGDSYDPAFFERLFKAEDQHFWFQARNRVIGAVVRRLVAPFPPGYRVLEVGCGTGNVLRVLEAECTGGTVTGMELFEEGLRFARQRTRCQLLAADVHTVRFDHAFDLVGLFDVLEHLEKDVQVLEDLNRLLLPGRCLLLTVPAHMSLWSYFDMASHHCRRYSRAELRQKLLQTGFEIEYLSEFMMPLYPVVWLARRLRSTGATAAANRDLAAQEFKIVPVLNGALKWVLSREANWIARHRHLPFGTSILALARKSK